MWDVKIMSISPAFQKKTSANADQSPSHTPQLNSLDLDLYFNLQQIANTKSDQSLKCTLFI